LAARVPDGPPNKGHHDYNEWYRADPLWMHLSPGECRQLGLFLLAAGFHGRAEDTTLLR